MKNFIALLFLFLAGLLSAQEKGASPISQFPISQFPGTTRAVVVGISNYQDVGIPDLRFADRDAEAFAAWLRSPAGGSVPERNLVLLTNERATTAQFAKALDGLIETAQAGDLVIIYFSGHGDVETKTLRQNGFLLCHDTPAATYMAGAYALTFLQDVVTTLSQQNKAKVIVVTDACRSGELAGSSINGSQLTSANLAKQFANEVKILSCQPNEFSLEGEQWGGGRGLFSFHLLDGLTGMADNNADGSVNLFEVGRYLDDHVPTEAAPHSQLPLTVGDRQALLAMVDAPSLAALRSAKSNQAATLTGTGMKGWEDDIVAAADSATQRLYHAFADALKKGEMLDAAEGRSSAADLLPRLLEKESLGELHGLLRRNLAAALQDEAQQALNAMLNDDPYEQNQWQYNSDKYARYPEYIAKAIELLGERHYMYKTLMAKWFFFQARTLATKQISSTTGTINNDSLNRATRRLLAEGLKFDPNAAYLYYAMGNTWFDTFYGAGLDSFFHYHNQAIALSPTWTMPRLDVVNSYLFNFIVEDWKPCEQYLLDALALKPGSFVLTERLAWLYQRMYRMEEAIDLARKMTALRPDLPNGFGTLSTTYFTLRQYDLTEEFARKSLSVDSNVWSWPMNNLGKTYNNKRQYEKAFQVYRAFVSKGMERNAAWPCILGFCTLKDPDLTKRYRDYFDSKFPTDSPCDVCDLIFNGGIHFLRGEFQDAKRLYLKSLPLSPTPDFNYVEVFTDLARIAWLEQQPDSAEYYFHKAINYHPQLFGSWARSIYPPAYYHYARFLLDQNRPADAEAQLRKAEEIDPRNPLNYYGMAILHARQKKQNEALDWLAKALEWYYPDYDEIMAEPLFQKIRKTKRFKEMMKQYFPNGSDRPLVEKLAREYLPEIFK